MAAKEWLECVPWDGKEASLPVGGQLPVPGLTPEKLVKRWEVLDAESDEGSRFVKAAELKPTDIIIGAEMNKKSLERLYNTYGPGFVTIKRATGGPGITWEQWFKEFGTDGLALWAIRNKRFGGEAFKIG